MKYFLIILFIFLTNVSFSKNITSKSFIYKKVYECGPKKWNGFEVNELDLYKYFFIHFDKFNNVVILNDGIQFKSFEKTSDTQLYYQNGGERTLNFSKNGNTYIFNLMTKEFRSKFKGGYFIRTLIFNYDNLTYQVRNSRQNRHRNRSSRSRHH